MTSLEQTVEEIFKDASAFSACACMGPQDDQPACPCMMNTIREVNGRWIQFTDLGYVGDPKFKTPSMFGDGEFDIVLESYDNKILMMKKLRRVTGLIECKRLIDNVPCVVKSVNSEFDDIDAIIEVLEDATGKVSVK